MKKTLGKIITITVLVILIGAFAAVRPSPAEEVTGDDSRFTAYDDGTVLDTKTNLLWAAQDNGNSLDWADAKFFCENYNAGDYRDWRMPTKEELNTLYNRHIFGNNGYLLTKKITLTGSYLWAADVKGSEAATVSFGHDRDIWCWDPLTHKVKNRTLPVRNGRDAKIAVVEAVAVPVAPPPPPPPPLPEKVTITLKVQFDNDKAVIKDIYHEDIKRVADFMQQYPETTVSIEGHTDEIGTKEYNQRLSEDRAKSVRQYLIAKFGISSKRLAAVGYGEDRPVDTNYTMEGRRKNRRVEAVIEAMKTK